MKSLTWSCRLSPGRLCVCVWDVVPLGIYTPLTVLVWELKFLSKSFLQFSDYLFGISAMTQSIMDQSGQGDMGRTLCRP